MLIKRILTAVIGIPIAIYIINFGQWLFAAAIYVIALAAWYEFSAMMRQIDLKPAAMLGSIAILLLLGCAWLGNAQELLMVLTLFGLGTFIKTVVAYRTFTVRDAAFTLFGIIYIGLSFVHLLLLRFTDASQLIHTSFGSISAGAAYLWLAFVGTWANDTLAFFVGAKLGRNKLCPDVSPGKTCEGALGGLIGSIAGMVALGKLFHFPLEHTIILGFMVGVIAPCGDLVESALKRFAGVKDSGNILPGHGGILDRFDSIMFAVPTVYYYLHFFML